MRKFFVPLMAMMMCVAVAEPLKVDTLRHAGEFALTNPVMIDSTDTGCHAWDVAKQIGNSLRPEMVEAGEIITDGRIVTRSNQGALHLTGFALYTPCRTQVTIMVKGLKNKEVTVDGKALPQSGEMMLNALWHKVVIKSLATEAGTDTVSVSVDGGDVKLLVADIAAPHNRSYNLEDVMLASRYYATELSADGRYISYGVTNTREGGIRSWQTFVKDLNTGNIVARCTENVHWLPRTCAYYITRTGRNDARELVAIDPRTGAETVLAGNLPKGSFTVAPTEDYLIFSASEEGPAEDKSVYQVIEPDDRQPGWRTRTRLVKYDLATGLSTPLTFGYHSVSLQDISADGKSLLVSVHSSRLTQRPTSLATLMVINLGDMSTDTIVADDGFIQRAQFSPDGKEVLVTGSPEAFGGIGKNVPGEMIPNMYDIQMFVVSLADKNVRAMTRTFNPSIQSAAWSKHDGMIYFTAEDRDYVNLFVMNPRSGATRRIDVPEDAVERFSNANAAPRIAFYGQGASNSDRLYTMEVGKWRAKLIDDLSSRT
ncbi:MAG: S9 family peptidase, partial [Muribaculaceae bacterium]